MNELMKLTETTVEKINELRSQLEQITAAAKEIVVMTVESVDEASHFIKKFANLDKRIDEARKEITIPLDNQKKAVMKQFESLKEIYSGVNNKLQKDVLSWNARQRQIEKEKQDLARAEAEERALNEAILKEQELKAQGIENPVVEPAIIPEEIIPEKKLSSFNGSGISEVRVAKWRVVNDMIIPREYMMLDESKITKHRRSAGVEAQSDIPGIEFYYETVIRR